MKPDERVARLLAALREVNDIIDPPGAVGAIPMEEGEVFDIGCVNKLSDRLLQEAKKLRGLKAAGTNAPVLVHGAMSPSAINTLAVEMMEACIADNSVPPKALCDLIRMQLGSDMNVHNAVSLERLLQVGRMFSEFEKNPNIGPTELGRLVGINKSGASRWLKEIKGVDSK